MLCLGLIQSLFEGSMYVFVLEWTPALTPPKSSATGDIDTATIPHGHIFAGFMVNISQSIFLSPQKIFLCT